MINLFSGGALLHLSVFALGIMPYIPASIIIQLLRVVIPRFEELHKEGQAATAKLTEYTRYLTIGLGLLQSSTIVATAKSGQLFQGCARAQHIIAGDSIVTPLLIIKFALTIIWLIGFEWVFALQARFENTVAGTLKNAFIFGISHIAMTAALVVVDAVFVALLVGSWFYMPGGLFLLVILGYGTMLMLHIPVTERVFKPYLQQ